MVLINLRHLTPRSLLRHSPLLPKQLPSLKTRCFSAAMTTAAMSTSTKKVLVPIANGSEPMEAVITIDVLRRSGADVTVASVEKQLRVDACHAVKIVADALISDCSNTVFDLITLPGGMPGATNLKDCGILESMVKKQAADGRPYAAVCASPAVALGSWGLLKGLKATCYPAFMEQLAPACATTVESRVQQDGKVVTSRGPGTTMEFAVTLVEQLYGKEKAEEVLGPLVMRPNHGDEYTITEFNPMQWTFDNCPQILVPIADGSEEMEAVMIIDILRRAKANVVVASVGDKLEILASRKVKLVADMLLDEAAKLSFDLIVLPGGLGGAQAFAHSEKLVNMLKKQRESNRPYGAICASPALVLEPNGLLKGKKATAFPAMCDKLSAQSEVDNRVVVDGNLITSRGPGTSMEFALAIVEKFFGRNKALELAKEVAGFRRKQKMVRAKNITIPHGGTSSSGIQFRDVQHKKQYKEMTKRDICLGRSLDLGFIASLGLGDEINGWIHNLKWDQLVSIRHDGYKHLIYEFFSSLKVVETGTDDFPAYTMFFKLKNQNCVVRPQDLAIWIGIDFEGLDNASRTWDSKQAWTDVFGIGVYHPHRCKSTKLKNPAVRVFHIFLTFTFHGRKETNRNVTVKDLLLMEAVITGKQVNSAKLLIKKLREIKAKKREIYWGILVTLICKKLGLEITPSDKANKITFFANNLLGDVTLCKMGLIKKNVSGEWFLIRDEMEEEATVQEGVPILEGENEGRVYVHKRKRTSIELGSSLNVEEMSSYTLDEIVSRFERIERF